jgi:hypothetical protein
LSRATALAALAVALSAAAVSGCGGEDGGSAQTTAAAAPVSDPGREVMQQLTAAARAQEVEAVEGLLSEASRRPGAASALLRRMRPFRNGYRVVVSERVTDEFGVVAVAHGPAALALTLKYEGGEWKVDTAGPLWIEILGPRPRERKKVGQIGVEVHGRGAGGDGLLWADGVSLLTKAVTGPTAATVFANLAEPLTPGRHVAVAFADRGGDAAARAWTFVAR